jgi:hypothetical protein
MERKKHFQIQTLTNKLNTYEIKLKELMSKRETILASANSIDSTKNNNLLTTINNLLTNKNDLEKKIIDTKTLLTSSKYEITRITNQIKILPGQLIQNIDNEQLIYNDSITNIENIIIDINNKHCENIKNAYLEKQNILSNINILQSQIKQQHDTITELQTHAHNSRKTILQELHQKKQQKIILQQQIKTVFNQNTIYYEHIEELTNINIILEQLKINIINLHYNNSQNISQKEIIKSILNNYITIIKPKDDNIHILDNPILNLDIEKLVHPEYINTIITEIDSIITNNTSRINIIKLKGAKAQLKINNNIDNIQNNSSKDDKSRNKVISFKDQYKLEKGKKNELINKLEELQYLYNNYDTIIINKITTEYNSSIIELEDNKKCSLERLNIMKDRLKQEYQENNTNLEKQNQIIQNNLSNYTQILHELTINLNNVIENIIELDKSNLELHTIDININQIETIIEKIKIDKTILELQNKTILEGI